MILIRQPYGRETPAMMLDQTASFWARKGYACVVQDVRGKFSSDGVFEPVVNEINDGHDTVQLDHAPGLVQRQGRHVGRDPVTA